MDTVAVTVTILDRKYKLKIRSEEEPYLRKAAELVDTQARSYGKAYAYQDYQDLLAMVALTQITKLTKIQESTAQHQTGTETHDAALMERLLNIEKLLANAVGSE